MQVALLGGWRFSAVLNKHPYSTCLNPHIGIYRPQRSGLMLRFPPHWRIWSIELDGKRRAFAHGLRKATNQLKIERFGVRTVFRLCAFRGAYRTGLVVFETKKAFEWYVLLPRPPFKSLKFVFEKEPA